MTFAPGDANSAADRFLCRLHHGAFNWNFMETVRDGSLPFPLNLGGTRLEDAVGTCDYVGVNYYSRMHLTFDRTRASQLFVRQYVPDHLLQGDKGVEHPYGEFYPEGLYEALRECSQLGKPVYILENGIPDRADIIRPRVLEHAVEQMRRSLADGVDLRGYFHWTLVDNFEWNEGWHLRFGLFKLDVLNQRRVARGSARRYSEIIRGLAPPSSPRFSL